MCDRCHVSHGITDFVFRLAIVRASVAIRSLTGLLPRFGLFFYFFFPFLLSGLSDSYHAHATTAPAPAITPAVNAIPVTKITSITFFPPVLSCPAVTSCRIMNVRPSQKQKEVITLKIDIDFDKLLNDSVNAAIDATADATTKKPDSASVNERLQQIAVVSATTTISILRNYHAALEHALASVLDNSDTTH